jgi:hypothetical protein
MGPWITKETPLRLLVDIQMASSCFDSEATQNSSAEWPNAWTGRLIRKIETMAGDG